jgi:hypothetical protein
MPAKSSLHIRHNLLYKCRPASGGRFDFSSVHRSNQIRKLHQVGDTEVRTPGREYHERIFRHRTGPTRR